LHKEADRIVKKYNTHFKDQLALGQSQYASVFEGSFLDFDWSNGDLVFANSTCFSDELMTQLSSQASRLKPGAIVVTFTKGLTSSFFELLERKRYRMSWGPATVFIHRRLTEQLTAIGPARLNILPSDANTYYEEGEMPIAPAYYGGTNTNSSSHYNSNNNSNHNKYEDDDIDYDIKAGNYRNSNNDDNDDDDDDDEEEDNEDEEEEEEEDASGNAADEEDDGEQEEEDEEEEENEADDEEEEEEEADDGDEEDMDADIEDREIGTDEDSEYDRRNARAHLNMSNNSQNGFNSNHKSGQQKQKPPSPAKVHPSPTNTSSSQQSFDFNHFTSAVKGSPLKYSSHHSSNQSSQNNSAVKASPKLSMSQNYYDADSNRTISNNLDISFKSEISPVPPPPSSYGSGQGTPSLLKGNRNASSEFAMLNSPQDTALLLRKRSLKNQNSFFPENTSSADNH
jgi:hypothetical protein